MSLVNDYLKQLGRKSINPEGKGVGSVPPSLHRTQKKSWKSVIGKNYLSLGGLVVLLSCLGYLFLSVLSILLYPVVDESVAVEPQKKPEESAARGSAMQPVLGDHVTDNDSPQLELVTKADQESTNQNQLDSKKSIVARRQAGSSLQPKENDTISVEGSGQKAVAAHESRQPDQLVTNTGNTGTQMESSMAVEEPRPLEETWHTTDGQTPQSIRDQKPPKRIIFKESHNTPDYIYQLGLQAQHSNKYGLAERYYRDVLVEVPDHENSLVNLSAIYIQEKRIQEAQVLLDTVLRKYPKNSKALVNFGMIELQQNKNDTAATYFLQALKFNPVDETALRNMAYLAQLEKNYDEASKYFLQLLQISPDNFDILLAYAGLEEMKQNYNSAIKIYRQCLEQISMQKNPEINEDILRRIQILKQYAAEQVYLNNIQE